MPQAWSSLKKNIFSDVHTIPEFLQKKHLPSLDGLRCFSILIVIIAHINNFHHPEFENKALLYLFGGGQLGVQFFFVLSGFIITTLLLTEKVKHGRISLRHFYIRRVLRIFPLAYGFLVVLIFLNMLFHLDILFKQFLACFLFVKNIDTPALSNWYVNHYWSLSVEEQYYLIFPFILTRGMSAYLKACFAFLLLFLFANVLLHFAPNMRPSFQLLLTRVFSVGTVSILIGSLSAIFLFKAGARFPEINRSMLNILLLFLILVASIAFYHPMLFGATSLICAIAVAAVILLLVKYPYGIFHRVLNNRVIAYIGKLSFSLYIWQQIFAIYPPWENSFKYGNSVILNVGALFIVAYFSYNYFEKPFLRLKERFREV